MTTAEQLKEKIIKDLNGNNRKPEQIGSNLGLEVMDATLGDEPIVRFSYKVAKPAHLNPYDGVHGGISAAVLDTALGVAACALADRYPVTTELALSYLRPMNGDHYIVKCEYAKIGTSLVACYGSIQDEAGLKYVTAQARYALTEIVR